MLTALLIASPYRSYLKTDTGRWLLSRKASNVISMEIKEATGHGSVAGQEEGARARLGRLLRAQWLVVGDEGLSREALQLLEPGTRAALEMELPIKHGKTARL